MMTKAKVTPPTGKPVAAVAEGRKTGRRPGPSQPFRPIWNDDGEYLYYIGTPGTDPVPESRVIVAGKAYLALRQRNKENGSLGGKTKAAQHPRPADKRHADWVKIAMGRPHYSTNRAAVHVRHVLSTTLPPGDVPAVKTIYAVLAGNPSWRAVKKSTV